MADRLRILESNTSLDVAGTKPWHMRMTVDLADDKGVLLGNGTIDEWWNGPDENKRVYALPGYAVTEMRTSAGQFRTKGASLPSMALTALMQEAVHPVTPYEGAAPETPVLRTLTLPKGELQCIMLERPSPQVAYPPTGLFRTFCTEKGKDLLLLTLENGFEVVSRNGNGSFQGKQVATQLAVSIDRRAVATGHITTLSSAGMPSEPFSLTGLEKVSAPVAILDSNKDDRLILHKVDPKFSEIASAKRIQGEVEIRTLVGEDGRVRNEVLGRYPESEVALSALAAVRQWIFRPEIRDGAPVPFEITIRLNTAGDFREYGIRR